MTRTQSRLAAGLVAVLAVLPMLVPLVWQAGAPHLSFDTDLARGALTPLEQPLTVRTFVGAWALLLVLAWSGLAYARQRAPLWEIGLVLLGSALSLVRLGNVWLTALVFLPALTNQLVDLHVWLATWPGRRAAPSVWLGCAALSLGVITTFSVLSSRPASLPADVQPAILAATSDGPIFTDWRWATALQQEVGAERPVLGAGGLNQSPTSYWYDYLRVSLAHRDWSAILHQHGVGVLVLDVADGQTGVAAEVRRSSDWRVLLDRDGVLVAQASDA